MVYTRTKEENYGKFEILEDIDNHKLDYGKLSIKILI